MKILYFAWLRSSIGRSEETLPLPPDVTTVSGLLDWLGSRGPEHSEVLTHREVIRVAVNQEFAELDDPVRDGDEVALFPPMTGG